jgi:hypothetical protein
VVKKLPFKNEKTEEFVSSSKDYDVYSESGHFESRLGHYLD